MTAEEKDHWPIASKAFAFPLSAATVVQRRQHKQDGRPHGFRNGFQPAWGVAHDLPLDGLCRSRRHYYLDGESDIDPAMLKVIRQATTFSRSAAAAAAIHPRQRTEPFLSVLCLSPLWCVSRKNLVLSSSKDRSTLP